MLFHQARCKFDIDLSFVFVGREIFSPVENFLRVEFFLAGRECFLSVENFLTVENFLHRSRNIIVGRELFGRSRIFWVCRSREIREAGREIFVGSGVFAPKRSACKSKENCFL